MSRERVSVIGKFVNTWHLSVEERRAVGTISGSEILDAILKIIENEGRYPVHYSADSDYQGTLLYRSDNTFIVVTKAEVGVQRYAVIEKRVFENADSAVRYAAMKIFPSGFDGVKIDW
ncbi:MAG TPA: hypothetical protein VLY03_03845 [Bacteroidota bacterium]|nr:hypothetical protein [Bacteroidota bacterium]